MDIVSSYIRRRLADMRCDLFPSAGLAVDISLARRRCAVATLLAFAASACAHPHEQKATSAAPARCEGRRTTSSFGFTRGPRHRHRPGASWSSHRRPCSAPGVRKQLRQVLLVPREGPPLSRRGRRSPSHFPRNPRRVLQLGTGSPARDFNHLSPSLQPVRSERSLAARRRSARQGAAADRCPGGPGLGSSTSR